jgi:hypothetical protein
MVEGSPINQTWKLRGIVTWITPGIAQYLNHHLRFFTIYVFCISAPDKYITEAKLMSETWGLESARTWGHECCEHCETPSIALKFERNSEMVWMSLNLRHPQNFGAIETISQCSQQQLTNFSALLSAITSFDNYAPVKCWSTIEIQKTYRVKNRRRWLGYWEICRLAHRDIDLQPALSSLDLLWRIQQTLNNTLSHEISHS